MDSLTERQRREVEYHKGHAALVAEQVKGISFDILTSPKRRWWNAYWDIWTYLMKLNLKGKRVLVVGCGAGDDALYFAKLGASVSAFDLSPDMLMIAEKLAATNGLSIDFRVMPSEALAYEAHSFDIVFARDILHHVDIPATMTEITRVSKSDALFVSDEIYSHSITDVIRHSWLVEKVLYPRMQQFIYKGRKPYITQDERKMTNRDIALVMSHLRDIEYLKYFNFLVTRIIPDKFVFTNKIDRTLLMVAGRFGGKLLAGRILLVGHVRSVDS